MWNMVFEVGTSTSALLPLTCCKNINYQPLFKWIIAIIKWLEWVASLVIVTPTPDKSRTYCLIIQVRYDSDHPGTKPQNSENYPFVKLLLSGYLNRTGINVMISKGIQTKQRDGNSKLLLNYELPTTQNSERNHHQNMHLNAIWCWRFPLYHAKITIKWRV